MNDGPILEAYDYAEFALYVLVASFCALRARSAWVAYSACTGAFMLWTFPAMFLDAYLGRDVAGIARLFGAPFYAAASLLIYAVIARVHPRPPQEPASTPETTWPVRVLGAIGKMAGRAVRLVSRRSTGGSAGDQQ